MKKLIVLLLPIMILLSCSEGEKTYTIETIEAVKHIHNIGPLWGDEPKVTLDLVRVFSSTDETNPNFQFYKPMDVKVDKDNNLYVLDAGDFRIQKYDPDGKYVSSFCRKGQGPGEFLKADGLVIDKEGNLYIVNNFLEVLKLDNQGTEINRIKKSGRRFDGFSLLNSGEYAIVMYADRNKDPIVGIFDKDLKFVRKIGTKEDHGDGEYDWLYNVVDYQIDNDDNFYFSYSNNNRIEKYELNGNLLWRADRPLNFEPKVLKNGGHDSPALISTGISVDGKNRIWVATLNRQITQEDWKKFDTEPEIASFHIFDNNGVFLGVVPVQNIKFFGGPKSFYIHNERLFVINNVEMSVTEYKIVEN